ncbi:12739_t:CDS:2, partial [Racocetra persica]
DRTFSSYNFMTIKASFEDLKCEIPKTRAQVKYQNLLTHFSIQPVANLFF